MVFRVHGGPNDGELQALGLRREHVEDLSASTNPYGPSPTMLAALRGVDVSHYPDSESRNARMVLAKHLNVDVNSLVLGNGAAELLWTLREVLPEIHRGVVIAEPTFCEFRAACVAGGLPVSELRASAEEGFQIELHSLARVAKEKGARVVYLCSPNTPTGLALSASTVAVWATAHPELSVVLDQSFLSLSDRFAEAAEEMPRNVIRVRSLTKDHGIPGVRVGYLLAAAPLARAIASQRPAWTVSAAAQAAAEVSVSDEAFVAESRNRLALGRQWLHEQLCGLGLKPIASTAPFLLVPVANAAFLRTRLLKSHGVLVRDCESFGLRNYLRFSVRKPPALNRLVDALRVEL